MDVSGNLQVSGITTLGYVQQNNGSSDTQYGSGSLINYNKPGQGANNTAIGAYALNGAISSGNCTAVGSNALKNCSVPVRNTAIGAYAGTNVTYSAQYNTFLGSYADLNSTDSYSYSTAIGYSSKITADNQIMMGTSNETVYIPGELSITTWDNTSTFIINNTVNTYVLSGYCTVLYDTAQKRLIYVKDSNNNSSKKCFVIDHPVDPVNKHLVHVCLEGPEAGVYYRGKGEIVNDKFTTIVLPDYVEALARDLTVQITPIYDGKLKLYNASEVENNQFNVYGENGKFHWIVHGKRGQDFEVEPIKSSVDIKGVGPYKWI